MERRDVLILAIAGILALVVGLTAASLLGGNSGFFSGNVMPGSIFPP